MFRIGQRVVCIRDVNEGYGWAATNKYSVPKVGCVYTIRDFDGADGLRVEEVVNPLMDCIHTATGLHIFDEPSFDTDRFRPVKETSIDVFTAMLAPTPNKKVSA